LAFFLAAAFFAFFFTLRLATAFFAFFLALRLATFFFALRLATAFFAFFFALRLATFFLALRFATAALAFFFVTFFFVARLDGFFLTDLRFVAAFRFEAFLLDFLVVAISFLRVGYPRLSIRNSYKKSSKSMSLQYKHKSANGRCDKSGCDDAYFRIAAQYASNEKVDAGLQVPQWGTITSNFQTQHSCAVLEGVRVSTVICPGRSGSRPFSAVQ
jgi:hypothetical protein